MIKRIMLTTLLVAGLMFSGCDESSDGEDTLNAQQMLDNGDYTGVIALLENESSSDTNNLLLGAAYMGKAGLSLSDIITIVTSSGDSSNGTFATFVEGVANKRSTTALEDLEKSTTYYTNVIGSKCTDSSLTLSDSQKDVCLFIGLSSTMKAATAISYIADDVTALATNTNGVDDQLKAASCAMEYAYDGNTTGCTSSSNGNVTFTTTSRTYEDLDVTYNGSTFAFLITNTTPKSSVVTDDYCPLDDFSKRVAKTDSTYNASTYYVCPVNESSSTTDITTAEVLVDAINSGIDYFGAIVSDDIKEDIDKFKCEILNGTYSSGSCTVSLTTDITTSTVITYLNNNNI